ncbi:MAG: ABC transporter substrate-binding protein [Alphaproteobacteria bacterium]|nr:ABC transporter substrate-binding protein [Alphaproteobacteria bacterium]
MKAAAFLAALLLSTPAHAGLMSLNLCTDQFALAFQSAGQKPLGVSFVAADKALSLYVDRIGDTPQLRGTPEEIVLYKPDLVLMGQGQNPPLQAWLKAREIPIAALGSANSIADAQQQLREFSTIWGKQSEAEALIAAQESAIQAAKFARPLRVAVYYARGFSDAGGTLFDEIIRRLGGVNIGAESGGQGMRYLSLESLVALKPDLLIVPQYDYGTTTTGEAMTSHPAFAAIGAEVVHIPGSYFTCPHLALAPLVQAIGAGGQAAQKRIEP